MKTIREISENTGISKVSLYKLIKKPELQDHIRKEGNATLIDNTGEQIIIEYYSRQRLATLNDILDESTEETEKLKENEDLNHVNKDDLQDVSHVYKDSLQDVNEAKNIDFMRILENQLNTKDEQIKEKDNQISVKDEQIRQKDNQLNALLCLLGNKDGIKLIPDNIIIAATPIEPEPAEQKREPNAEPEPPQKKSFFHRFFKKK